MVSTPTDLCLVPAGPPPTGQQSNFDNPTSLAPMKISIVSILIFWGILFTAGRFYVNIRRLSWGDYFALLALLLSIVVLGLMSTQVKLDRHIWDVPACYFDGLFAKNIFFPALFFNLGSFFAKTSIFMLFHQIFTVQKTMRCAIQIGLAYNFLLYGSGVAVATYYETPRAGEAWSAILDASIASFVERIYVGTSLDQTWISPILSLCSAVELNVAIIVSSGPGFASFARNYIPAFSSVTGSFFSISYRICSGSEGALRGQDIEYANSDKPSSDGSSDETPNISTGKDGTLTSSLRYYGLSDSHTVTSGVTTDDEKGVESKDNGIMRTILVKQLVKTASAESVADPQHFYGNRI